MKNIISKFISWFAHRGSITVTMEQIDGDCFLICVNGSPAFWDINYKQAKIIYENIIKYSPSLLTISKPKKYKPTGNKILKETIIKK